MRERSQDCSFSARPHMPPREEMESCRCYGEATEERLRESGQPLHKLCDSPRCHCLFIYPLSIWVRPCIKLIPPAAFCLVEQAQSPVKCLWKAGDCVCGAPGVPRPSAPLYLPRTDGIRSWERGWMTLWRGPETGRQWAAWFRAHTQIHTNKYKAMYAHAHTLPLSHVHNVSKGSVQLGPRQIQGCAEVDMHLSMSSHISNCTSKGWLYAACHCWWNENICCVIKHLLFLLFFYFALSQSGIG